MQLTPLQSLLVLVLIGLAIGGWVYGIHWKKVAMGDGFTQDEKLIFQLQEQLDILTRQNADLNAALQEADPNADPEAVGKPKPGAGAPISNAPLLQESLQEVELPKK